MEVSRFAREVRAFRKAAGMGKTRGAGFSLKNFPISLASIRGSPYIPHPARCGKTEFAPQ